MRRRSFTAAMAVLASSSSRAQGAYPSKPIRWIVGFPAGGASDAVVRYMADAMQPSMGQPLIVDNRPGASGQIAVAALRQSPPDGYTIMNAENSTLMFNEHLYPKLAYNPRTDFSYIGAIGHVPVTLVVNPAFPAKTLAEFIARAKAAPGSVNFASAGNTSLHRIAMEMFQRAAGLELTHVPYRGGTPAIQDLIGSQVESMMMDLTIGLQNIRAGQVRPLAVAAPHRIASIPDVPTFAELGFKQVNAFTLHGVLGPAGLPAPVIARLNNDINKAMRQPRVLQLFADAGLEATPGTPANFRNLAATESARWGEVIRNAGIKGE
ncbi:MAG: tripartite tricarboxylate transporter substrate binding protein [Pseudomonadota bacterium]